jgi:hypothetical protein
MSTGDAPNGRPNSPEIDAGVLPREHPKQISGVYGFGDACNGCGDSMRLGQGVIEFDVAGRLHRLHTGCYGFWEGELIRRGLFKPR